MHSRFTLLFLAGISLIPAVQAQTPSPVPTVDELVAKNIQAKGGQAALDAIKTIRFEFAVRTDAARGRPRR